MKKRIFAVLLTAALVMAFGLSGCGSSQEAPAQESATEKISQGTEATEAGSQEAEATEEVAAEPEVDGSAYGYAGSDPLELAVYRYMVEEESKNFDKADVSIPTVNIVAEDYTKKDEVTVYGDFWLENYNIKGDTLECVSGGNFPGVMHLSKDGDGYTVTSMDLVADGSDWDSSARELFGDHYEDFIAVNSDSDAREELRKITVSDYVNLNGLSVTKYQDYGWDPVDLYLQ